MISPTKMSSNYGQRVWEGLGRPGRGEARANARPTEWFGLRFIRLSFEIRQKIPTGFRTFTARQCLGRALGDDVSALGAAPGAKVDNPI